MFGHLNCGFLKRHQTGSIMLCPPLFQGPKTIIRAVLSSEFVSLKSDAALDHRSLSPPSRPVRVRPRRTGWRS